MFKKAFFAVVFATAFIFSSFAAWNGSPLKKPQDFNPAVVNIIITKDDGKGLCTGTYFDNKWFKGHRYGFILTAGHCVIGATSFEVAFHPRKGKEAVIVKSEAWVRHEMLMEPDELGGLDLSTQTAHKNHDVAIIMIKDIPSHAKPIPLLRTNPRVNLQKLRHFIISRTEEEKFETISPFVSTEVTNIKLFSSNKSKNPRNLKTSLLFDSRSVKAFNGICPGDSGGPVVVYRNDKPYLVGTVSAIYDAYPINFFQVCGDSIIYYGVSYNYRWVDAAIHQLLNKFL